MRETRKFGIDSFSSSRCILRITQNDPDACDAYKTLSKDGQDRGERKTVCLEEFSSFSPTRQSVNRGTGRWK